MFSTTDPKVVMKVNDLKCAFHMPNALVPKFRKKNNEGYWTPEDGEESKGEEMVQPLPKGAPRFAYSVEEYPSSPTTWMRGGPKASSYWLPVRSGCGMWLDMNYNYDHSHHVAAVISIQGVNPITGQKVSSLRLEQYREKCPVHDVEFGQDRFCVECNFKWDAQNYISTNATPRGLFWIDGFRGDDGVVRQYIFTKDTCKGVAANIIGDERVFAIGIAFYLSKEPKVVKPLAPELRRDSDVATFKRVSTPLYSQSSIPIKGELPPRRQHSNSRSTIRLRDSNDFVSLESCKKSPDAGGAVLSAFPPSSSISPSIRVSDADLSCGDSTTDFDAVEFSKTSPKDINSELQQFSPEEIEQEMEKLEITAGAMIRQRIFQDPEQLDFWQDEPAGFLYINYTDIATAEKIMSGGRDVKSGSFLSKLPIG